MLTNNLKLKILVLAMAAPLLFFGCSSNSGENQETKTTETLETKNKLEDAASKSVQSNSDRFSDVKVFENVAEATKKHINSLLNHYLALKDAMVNEQATKAKSISEALLEELETFDETALPVEQKVFYDAHTQQIKESATEISTASGVGEQRDGLANLTNELYSLAKAYQANQETLYYQYCPMAFDNEGGYWISNTEEIENPYFGDEMLTCGATRATLEAGSQK